jgi:signal transduction histidine kinase
MFIKILNSWILFSGLGFACYGQPVVTINSEKENIDIIESTAILKDSTAKLSFKDVSSKLLENNFVVNSLKMANYGSTRLPVWCRFTIQNFTEDGLVLTIDNSQIESLDLFTIVNNAVIHKSISAYRPFQVREVYLNKCFFLLDIPKDSTERFYLRLQTQNGLQFPLRLSTRLALAESEQSRMLLYGVYIGIMLIMILYNLFIFLAIRDLSYLYYILYVSFMTLTNVTDKGIAFEYLWPSHPVFNHYVTIIGCITGIFAILFAMSFLHVSRYSKSLTNVLNGLIFCYLISIGIVLSQERYIGLIVSESLTLVTTLTLLTAGIIVFRKGYKPAFFYLLAWSCLVICVIIFLLEDLNLLPYNNFSINGLTIGSAIETLLLSLALANRINVYKKQKEKAKSQLLISMEDNRKLITEQNIILEKKVGDRTWELKEANAELNNTLENLKATQAQLIQSEKMASLGELTAGIAHEIRNPLNFINNFSEVSAELLEEMENNVDNNNDAEVKKLATEVKQNLEKIIHHGKRADAIVKGMLLHSHPGSGQKEPTGINDLATEYLRLAYHGFRAKEKSFKAALNYELDPGIGIINIIPQDIGRVLLNLYNNAFYAVNEKSKEQGEEYQPAVLVKTQKVKVFVEVSVCDNGKGVPAKVAGKIFQPFFTTKPTGEGTGLGLSLCYDIIKAHGGSINLETTAGEGSAFIIRLPVITSPDSLSQAT